MPLFEQVLCEVCLKMVPLFCIPLIYGVSRFLYKKCGFEGSLVHRIIVGLLFTAAANAISLCYYKAIEGEITLNEWLKQGRIEHPIPPDVSGVGGWNLGLTGVEFCNFFDISLYYKQFYG